MTSFTGPLIVTSAGGQGDGSSVFKVSGNGKLEAAGHALDVSSLSVAVDTTAAAVAGAGANAGAVPSSAEFAKITVNGTEFKIALYS